MSSREASIDHDRSRRGAKARQRTPPPAAAPGEPTPLLDMRPAWQDQYPPVPQIDRDVLRVRLASWAFTTRRVPADGTAALLAPTGRPEAGDLVLARVDAIGHHGSLHMANGRRRHLFVGDEIVVAYGNRYASNQFEAYVPETLGPCHLVAGGGLAARAVSWHAGMREPTRITPIGLPANAGGEKINLRDFMLAPAGPLRGYAPTTIAVAGTSMDSGKTQTAVHLVRGLIAAGLRVGYAKVTGTGAGGDYWWLKDAGADPVLDFTDVGLASTYRAGPKEIEDALVSLVTHVASRGVDATVLEVADGLLQGETAALLDGSLFPRLVGGIVLAARDSMGALAGVRWLSERPTPTLALTGILTAAPLQIREAREATGLPVYDRQSLASPEVAMALLGGAQRHTSATAAGWSGAA